MSERTCTVEGCKGKLRARGLCATHYNRTRSDRHRKREVPCAHCAAPLQKFPAAGRRSFCDYTCRDLYMMQHGLGAWGRRGALLCDQPSWPGWMGKTCPIVSYDCTECRSRFFARPTKLRDQAAFCTTRCRWAFKRRSRRSIKKAKRVAIFARDNYMCWLCDKPCDQVSPFPHPMSPTIDHITPRSKGGTDEPDNLACAHFICNSTRQDSWDFPVIAVA